ncbi:MAG TPA: nucleoside deaminase [Candidatus Saccharimonadales bacterium]|jgi:tRNA(Arg) A34 adenosine deaminase TadA
MRLALAKADSARQHGDMPFGAVITSRGKLVVAVENGEGQDIDITAHAELLAIRQACKLLGRRDLSDCEMYASVEPCPMCSSAIFQSNIPRIAYSLSRDDLPHIFRLRKIRIAQLADDWDYTPEVVGGILTSEALTAFEGLEQSHRVVPQFHSLQHQTA